MGFTNIFDIQGLKDGYNLENYIETGTGAGISLSHALKFSFKKNISFEIFEPIFEKAKDKFKNQNCEIVFGNSYEKLPDILRVIEGNTLFWLDAHFPGADFGYRGYGDELDIDKRLPLERELRVIVENYDNYKNSVFLIDDLRIYEDGPFESGNWSDRSRLGLDGVDFIHNLFDETHTVEKDYRFQGYIILKPKSNKKK